MNNKKMNKMNKIKEVIKILVIVVIFSAILIWSGCDKEETPKPIDKNIEIVNAIISGDPNILRDTTMADTTFIVTVGNDSFRVTIGDGYYSVCGVSNEK